jgi:hypothetical protein
MHDPDLTVVTFVSRAHPYFEKVFSDCRVLACLLMLPLEVLSEIDAALLSCTQEGLQNIEPISPTQGPAQVYCLLMNQKDVSKLILKNQLEKFG